jgi:hypothetical protein
METPNESKASTPPNLLSRFRSGLSYLKLPAVALLTVFAVSMLIMTAVSTIHAPVPRYTHLTGEPQTILDCRDDGLAPAGILWVNEVERRFHQPVVVLLCHGGNVIPSEWVLQDNPMGVYGSRCEDALTALDQEHAMYPNRIVVCLACNPMHMAVHNRPWLYYSPSSTWIIPDRYLMSQSSDPSADSKTDGKGSTKFPNALADRSADDPNTIGNAFELVQGN